MRPLASGGRIAAVLLAWLAGVACQLHERSLPSLSACVGACGITALSFVASRFWCRFGGRRTMATAVAAALAGFAVSGWRATGRLRDALAPQLEGRDLVVSGVVASRPQRGPSGLRFRFAIDPEVRERSGQPELIALGWFSGFDEDAALTQPQRELRAGPRWRFAVRLRRPHGNLDPDGFDYEGQLFEQGVRATGYLRDARRRSCSSRRRDSRSCRNRFGHPAPGDVERYRERGIAILATPACAAWQWIATSPAGGAASAR